MSRPPPWALSQHNPDVCNLTQVCSSTVFPSLRDADDAPLPECHPRRAGGFIGWTYCSSSVQRTLYGMVPALKHVLRCANQMVNTAGRPLGRAPVTRFTTPIGLRRRDCYRGLAVLLSRLHLASLSLARSAPWCESHRGLACSELQPKCSHASWAAGYGPQRHKTCPRPCGQPAFASSRLVSSSPHPNSGTCFQLFQLLLQLDASISRSFVSLGKRRQATAFNSSTRQLANPTTRYYRGLAQAARANLESIVSGRRRFLLELG